MSAFSLKRGKRSGPGGATPMMGELAPPGASKRVPPLTELSAELFSVAISLKGNADIGDPQEVRRKILLLLERFDQEARDHGYSSTQVDHCRFALVAMLDEAVLSSTWVGKDLWRSNPLQRELYKINVAGQEFFTRLESLRANRAENRRVLEVYHGCLAMGFEGQYKLLGREKLEGLIRELSNELADGRAPRAEQLSPAWRRPDDFPETVGGGVPVWMTAAIFVPAALLLIVLFGAVARISSDHTADAIQRLLTR